MATSQVSASISMSASGTSTAYGNLTWTAPSLPDGAVISDISVSGTYNWSGRGNVTVYINGQSLYSGSDFNVSLGSSAASPYQISCRGGNKNATGSSFSWETLRVTYTYTVPGSDILYIKVNGTWTAATAVYKKVSGSWVQQTNLTNVFESGVNYHYSS